MVRLKHPSGGGVGFNGQEYDPDENGVVTVPDSAAEPLIELHGYAHATDAEDVTEDSTVGAYTVKHQGRGKFMVLKCGEQIAAGMTKDEATAKVAELTKPE